jgi:hypothetical protein
MRHDLGDVVLLVTDKVLSLQRAKLFRTSKNDIKPIYTTYHRGQFLVKITQAFQMLVAIELVRIIG